MEEGFDFLFMRHGVDGEVEIVEGEVFAVVCVFLEDEYHPIQGKDGFEDAEVLGEEKKALDVQSFWANCVKLGVLFGGLFVDTNIVVVNIGQAAFHLHLAQHHRLLHLWGRSLSFGRVAVDSLLHRNHELLVIILENFPPLLLLALL